MGLQPYPLAERANGRERDRRLYIREGVTRVEAAAFMGLTPAIVRYAVHGLALDAAGNITRRNQVFAKISRAEVARKFLEPAPAAILQKLLNDGLITAQEAELAGRVPIAEDIIVESDSGGHTDNRPLGVLFPIIRQLRDDIAAERQYTRPIRVGAAGGLGVPSAVAAAFSMGAAFVLTGTVNQACVESGLDQSGKEMLAKADMADVIMAPAADMFEMGVDVQVLKRGTMFASRARKLYELYRNYPSLDAIPADQREQVESKILKQTFREAWASTRDYWAARDMHEVHRAESDPKHQMALVFRAYLGQSSRWAINGVSDRASDFQIWCGPAMGSFNTWTQGTFLQEPQNRTVVQVARNLMEGACVATRAQQLRTFGAAVPTQAFEFKPRPLA
ncbi:MAG: PfaD family polyunsaturated fatty acid/polyketide biosynthesis protein [bacterium]